MSLFHGVATSEFKAFRDSTYGQWSESFLQNLYMVTLDALPFLALGFFIAGLLKSFVPDKWVLRVLGNPSSWFLSPLKGAVFGTPLPLCSCSVVPVVVELKKQGANKGSLVSFLVSGPETGADSLSLSYALLGPIMMVARLLSALATAIVTAWTVIVLTGKHMPTHDTEDGACCTRSSHAHTQDSCRHTSNDSPKTLWYRFLMGQRCAFTNLLDDVFKYMVLALIFTAVMRTFVPATFLGQHSYGLFPMALAVLVALPMYVCASAATPIAAWLILSGISPGVALVFMLAGPASNIATLMVVSNMLGRSAMIVYVVSISVLSILAGQALNTLEAIYNWNILSQTGQGYILNKQIALALSIFIILCAIKPLRKYIGKTIYV